MNFWDKFGILCKWDLIVGELKVGRWFLLRKSFWWVIILRRRFFKLSYDGIWLFVIIYMFLIYGVCFSIERREYFNFLLFVKRLVEILVFLFLGLWLRIEWNGVYIKKVGVNFIVFLLIVKFNLRVEEVDVLFEK